MKSHFTRTWLVPALAVAVGGVLTDQASAQRARRGTNDINSFGSVGISQTSSGMILSRMGAAASAAAARGVAQGNYVNQAGPARMPLRAGARPRGRSNMLAPFRPRAVGIYNTFANPLDFSLARAPTPMARDFTGYESWARARIARFGAGEPQGSAYMALQNSKYLLHRYSFLGPVREANKGGRIRDSLTNTTLRNMPDPVETWLDPSVERKSFSEIMENRLNADRAQRIETGWAHFMNGRYQMAIGCFQCASVRRTGGLEPRVAMLLTEIVSRQLDTAGVLAEQLVPDIVARPMPALCGGAEGPPNPFRCDIDLRALASKAKDLQLAAPDAGAEGDPAPLTATQPWSEEELDALLESLAIRAEQDPDPHTVALRVFLLWYSGDRRSALREADNLHREHRESPFARMADDMRAVMNEEAAEDSQADATAP